MTHLKRIAMPRNWPFLRKEEKYIVRPNPGANSSKDAMPISAVLKELMKVCDTTKQAKTILLKKNVFVNGRKIKDHKFAVGLLDIITIPAEELYFRIVYLKGKLSLIQITPEEANLLMLKIVGKTVLKGNKIQLNFFNGFNIIVDKDEYSTKDSLLFNVNDKKINGSYKFEKDALLYIIGGSHKGNICNLEEIKGNKILIKNEEGQTFETYIKYAYVVGKDKPIISLNKE